MLAKVFQFGRYELVSSSREGSEPANLQGRWNEDLLPNWGSKYTVNINTEMNYWPAEVTNLSECHLPLFDMLKDLAENGAETAKDYYNAGGWVLVSVWTCLGFGLHVYQVCEHGKSVLGRNLSLGMSASFSLTARYQYLFPKQVSITSFIVCKTSI